MSIRKVPQSMEKMRKAFFVVLAGSAVVIISGSCEAANQKLPWNAHSGDNLWVRSSEVFKVIGCFGLVTSIMMICFGELQRNEKIGCKIACIISFVLILGSFFYL